MTLVEALGLADARLVALVGAGGKTSLMFALAREFADAGEAVLLTTTTRLAADEAAGPWPGIVATDSDAIIASSPRSGRAVLVHAGIDVKVGKALGIDPGAVDQVAASGVFNRIVVEADGSARRPLKVPAAHEPVIPRTADTVIAVAGLYGIDSPFSDETVFRFEAWSRLTGLAAGDVITSDAVAHAAAHPMGFTKGAPATARRVLLLNQADTPGRVAAAQDISRRLAEKVDGPFVQVVIARLQPAPEIAEVIALDRGGEVPR